MDIFISINPNRCTGCGLCVTVCPKETLSMDNSGKAIVSGTETIVCGHCEAVCPTGALTVDNLSGDAADLATIAADDTWMPHGDYDTASLVQLMRSRRSCRNFTKQPVGKDLLEDLVKIGISAPSGSNSQKWTFTILPTAAAVQKLGASIASFFANMNRMAKNRLLRTALKFVGKGELDEYYHNYYATVSAKLNQWKTEGKDFLFWEATAIVVVGSEPGGSCPAEDALLASQNILLAAHAMGLGTCLIGYAVEAIKREPKIKDFLEIPPENSVHAVIALGYPNEQYARPARRKKVVPRWIK